MADSQISYQNPITRNEIKQSNIDGAIPLCELLKENELDGLQDFCVRLLVRVLPQGQMVPCTRSDFLMYKKAVRVEFIKALSAQMIYVNNNPQLYMYGSMAYGGNQMSSGIAPAYIDQKIYDLAPMAEMYFSAMGWMKPTATIKLNPTAFFAPEEEQLFPLADFNEVISENEDFPDAFHNHITFTKNAIDNAYRDVKVNFHINYTTLSAKLAGKLNLSEVIADTPSIDLSFEPDDDGMGKLWADVNISSEDKLLEIKEDGLSATVSLSWDESNPSYLALHDKNGNVIDEVHIPIADGLQSVEYDASTKTITFTYITTDGTTEEIDIDLSTLVDIDGIVTSILEANLGMALIFDTYANMMQFGIDHVDDLEAGRTALVINDTTDTSKNDTWYAWDATSTAWSYQGTLPNLSNYALKSSVYTKAEVDALIFKRPKTASVTEMYRTTPTGNRANPSAYGVMIGLNDWKYSSGALVSADHRDLLTVDCLSQVSRNTYVFGEYNETEDAWIYKITCDTHSSFGGGGGTDWYTMRFYIHRWNGTAYNATYLEPQYGDVEVSVIPHGSTIGSLSSVYYRDGDNCYEIQNYGDDDVFGGFFTIRIFKRVG